MTDQEIVENLNCISCAQRPSGNVKLTTHSNGTVLCEWECGYCGKDQILALHDESRVVSRDMSGVQDLTGSQNYH